ncbi:MAG: FecR family protein [Bdellovibrio sp.]
MKKNGMFSIQYVVLCLSMTLFYSYAAVAADTMHGIFMVVKGDVSVSNSKQQNKKIKVGDKVFPGDVVESAKEARAKIVMTDRNVINISPETKLEIQKYENDGANKNVELNLQQGKVRNNVEQKYDGEKNKFIIKTPTAVAGVRGTQFFTSFDPSTRITSVVTLRGAVSLAPANVATGNMKPVIVQKGESSTMAPGSNPEPPKALPKEELRKIDQETTASSAPKQGSVSDVAKSETPKAEQSRSPSSSETTTSTATAPTHSMVEVNDVDAGQFKEIRMPTADVNQPLTAPPTLVNPVLPPPPPTSLINNIIGGANGPARVIITPVPQ